MMRSRHPTVWPREHDHAVTASAAAAETSERGQGSRIGAQREARSGGRVSTRPPHRADRSAPPRGPPGDANGSGQPPRRRPGHGRRALAGSEDWCETGPSRMAWAPRRRRHGRRATTCRSRERRRKQHRPRAAASAAARSRRAEPVEVARPAQRVRPAQRRCFGTARAAVDLRGVARGSDGELRQAPCSRFGGGRRPASRSRRGSRTDAQRKAAGSRGAPAPRTPQARPSVLPEGPVGARGKPHTAASAAAQGGPRKPPASVYWREVQGAGGGGASVPPALRRVTARRPREWQQPPGTPAAASAVAGENRRALSRLEDWRDVPTQVARGASVPRASGRKHIASPNGSAAG